MLVGYNKDEQEIGMMPIEFMISASDESYIWGPNFGAEIGGSRLKQMFRIQIFGTLQTFSRSNGITTCSAEQRFKNPSIYYIIEGFIF